MNEKKDLLRGLEGLRKLAGDVDEGRMLWPVLKYGTESSWGVTKYGSCTVRDTLARLADEIEAEAESERPATTEAERRVLEMWPRFEDGRLVRFGDRVECRGKACRLMDVKFVSDEHEHVETFLYVTDADDVFELSCKAGERIKHPEVLDADGVPIKVGGTVWDIKDGAELVITSTELDKLDHVKASQENPVKASVSIHPTRLTHQRPVLDAEGAPIHVGDTVWIIPECRDALDEPHKVRCINRWGEVLLEFHTERSTGLKGEYLTHTRPDSWERLEKDAREFACDNRLPRVAEQMGRDVIDLVRRAKALAGAER